MALDLFSPVKLGSISLKNRMVMAPLTRNRAGEGGVPQDINVTYYEQRATAGLIITEATPISAMAHGYPTLPGIYTDAQVAGWKKVTDAVHAKGGKIVLQLWHVGRISHPSLLPNGALPVAPSAIKPAGQAFTYQGLVDYVEPRALDVSELPAIVQDYVHATKCAFAAGFDGVEIHSANGYLLDQFLRDGSNKRTDNYGGSLENRARLLMEVTQAVVNVAGADKVGVRLSPVNPFNDMHDSNPQACLTMWQIHLINLTWRICMCLKVMLAALRLTLILWNYANILKMPIWRTWATIKHVATPPLQAVMRM